MKRIRGTGNNRIVNAFFEFLWGIEVGLILVLVDYFIMSNVLGKLKVSCADTACTQSAGYYFLYYLSVIIWMFAIAYPIFLFIKALKGRKK